MLKVKKRLTILCLCLALGIIGAASSQPIKADNFYIVKKGDTLGAIALSHNTTTDELVSLNNIANSDLIYIGQRIIMPNNTNTYVVQKGDTLSELANYFNLKILDLISVNKIVDSEKIFVGQKLVVPVMASHINEDNTNLGFLWPADGNIENNTYTDEHSLIKGLTISNNVGTPIRASQSGQVVFSGPASNYGLLVILRHSNGYETYYAHNLRNLVDVGEKIKQGKIIAYMGNSGEETVPQLHFEIRDKNIQLNPIQYLPVKNNLLTR